MTRIPYNKKDMFLASMLYDSIEDCNISDIKQLLSEKGANPNVLVPKKGISPFHLAIGWDDAKFAYEVTLILLKYGGNPNIRSIDGLTPLHIASAWGRLDILRALLNCGGDPYIKDVNYMTPIDYSYDQNQTEISGFFKENFSLVDFSAVADREEEENSFCDLVLDKVLVKNGDITGEYQVDQSLDCCKSENKSNLDSIPLGNSTQYILNWIDSVAPKDESYIDNVPIKAENISANSDLDRSESDGPPKSLSVHPNVTQRRKYSPKKRQSDTSEKTIENTCLNDTDKFVSSSRESGILTLPMSSFNDSLSLVDFEKMKKMSVRNDIDSSHPINDSCMQNNIALYRINDSSMPNGISLRRNNDSSLQNDIFLRHYSDSSLQNDIDISSQYNNDSSRRNDSSILNDFDSSLQNVIDALSYVGIDTSARKETIDKQKDTSSDYYTCTDASDCNVLEKNISESNLSMISSDISMPWVANSIMTSDNSANNTINRRNLANRSFDKTVVSVTEIYKYLDPQEGVVLYEKRLLVTPTNALEDSISSAVTSQSSAVSSLPQNFDYDTDALRSELCSKGVEIGPITKTTKRIYLKKLYKLRKQPAIYTNNDRNNNKRVYSRELERTLKISEWELDLAIYRELDSIVSSEFGNPDSTRKWREGVNKSSFNYLLLDPRITQNLPCRADDLPREKIWELFLQSIFYIGKGKRSRPYSHLYEALNLWNCGSKSSKNKKLQTILDIWSDNKGVVCLHIFQNVIPVEAYTREASMISAIRLDNLKNAKSGDFYGKSSTWSGSDKNKFGVFLLYRAMNIFLQEGERQLSPKDID